MKNTCEVIGDLLPLYADKVCSESSKEMVENHLQECGECRRKLEALQNTEYEETLRLEQQEIIGHQRSRFKRKAFLAGSCIAGILLIPVIVCLIVNLATGHALDWFFIVLTSLLVAASLTVVPLMVERKRWLVTLGSFTVSLLLLLFTCCLYTGGKWFWVASLPVLLGLSILFMPYVISQLEAYPVFRGQKGLFSMIADTLLLFAMLYAIGLYVNMESYWRPAMLNAVIFSGFAWLLFLTIRYLKVNGLIRAGLSVIECSVLFAFVNDIENWIMHDTIPGIRSADLTLWTNETLNGNIFLTVLIAGSVLGLILILAGICGSKKNKNM